MTTKKIEGSVWFLILIVALVGVFVVIPNFKELLEDGSILFYVFMVCLIPLAIYLTRKNKKIP